MGTKIPVRAPEMSSDDPGTIKVTKWLVADGDHVRAGATVAEIETDKAELEIEAPEAGRLTHCVSVGAESSYDAVLAEIDPAPTRPAGGQASADAERIECPYCHTIYRMPAGAVACPTCGAPPKASSSSSGG